MMQIQINYGDIEHSQALTDHVNQAIDKALANLGARVTRVEVHLRDDKQGRSGPDDRRCVMEARLAGEQPLVAEHRDADIYKAVTETAGKLGRAATRKVERAKG